MPKVGSKEYSYDEKGKKAAAAEAARTGKPVISKSRKAGPKKPRKGGKKTEYPLEMDIDLPVVGDLSIGAGPTDGFKGAKAGLVKRFKEGGVVYSNARGGRSATQGTKYRG